MTQRELTDRQHAVLCFIVDYIEDKGYPPTVEEIRRHMKVASKSTAAHYLRALKDKGYIEIESGSRALRVVS